MRVMIVLDTSLSTKNVIGTIIRDAKRFLTFLRPKDEGLIMTFDHSVYLMQDFTSDQKKLRKGLDSALTALEIGSNLDDALYNLLTRDGGKFNGRKAIVVLSDGAGGGNKDKKKVYSAIAETDVAIYPIFYQTHRLFPSNVKSITYEQLFATRVGSHMNWYARVTGGRVFAAEGSDFAAAFQKVADELRKQYMVTVSADLVKDLDDIRIGVNRPDVIVRHKEEGALAGPPTLKEPGATKKN